MLYQEARDMAYAAISDDATNEYFITTDQMEAFANKALQELIEATEHKDCDVEWTISAGVETIAIGGTLSRMSRIEVDYTALRTTTQDALRSHGIDWRSHDGLTRYYYTDGLGQSNGGQLVGVYPKPDATYNLRVMYVCTPADVVLANDMELPDWCSEAVVWSMLSDIYSVDTEIMNIEAAAFYRMLFRDTMKRLRIRSFDRLPKAWAYKASPSGDRKLSAWDNFPENIPAP